MSHRVTLIPGDGIGPELAEATRRVLDASGVSFDWEVVDAGEAVMAEHGTPLPDHVLESIKRNRVALKGPITTPVGEGFRSVNVTLRQALGLYANVRPGRSIKGVESRYTDIDLVIVRENTEDLYAGIEHRVGRDAAESIKIITREASERIARYAFEYAVANRRRKVTAVHKANIMKLSDGLFLEACRTVAADYAGRVEFEDRIVDNMCMQLVQKPELYDVLVLPNLYGDIVSDLVAGLAGGLGVLLEKSWSRWVLELFCWVLIFLCFMSGYGRWRALPPPRGLLVLSMVLFFVPVLLVCAATILTLRGETALKVLVG